MAPRCNFKADRDVSGTLPRPFRLCVEERAPGSQPPRCSGAWTRGRFASVEGSDTALACSHPY